MALSKAEKVRNYFRKHPDAEPHVVAEKFETNMSAVYKARKTVQEEPRARKKESRDLIEDVKIINEIGRERVAAILELLNVTF